MTLKKVAELAGVSRTTVSLVVNNADASRVSPKTRKRVLDAVEKLNYKPNLIARRLSLQKANSIGLLIPFAPPLFSNVTNVAIIGGVQEVANEYGVDLVLFSSEKNYTDRSGHSAANILQNNTVDGVIICNSRSSTREFVENVVDLMETGSSRAVLLEYYWGDADIHYVGADYDDGIYQAIQHFIHRGHRQIGLITPPQKSLIAERMAASYRAAHQKENIPVKGSLIVEVDFTAAAVHETVQDLIHRHPGMSALFVGDYEMAVTAMKAVKEMGLKIPGDISVISFADHDVFPYIDPSLSAVSIPYNEMGRKAAQMLLGGPSEKKNIVLPTALEIRESSGYGPQKTNTY